MTPPISLIRRVVSVSLIFAGLVIVASGLLFVVNRLMSGDGLGEIVTLIRIAGGLFVAGCGGLLTSLGSWLGQDKRKAAPAERDLPPERSA
ncbi:MAG TPA: hypothetical protein VM661_05140 [Candidatus Sulfotelmatobacter sp.]|jgi:hypothetical protein|nr:hypothetical protein [Candidatus Sulfotelmatobacter sp.]